MKSPRHQKSGKRTWESKTPEQQKEHLRKMMEGQKKYRLKMQKLMKLAEELSR